jgi:hypothetical protein
VNPNTLALLSWASYAGAAGGFIVYFVVLLRRPQWVRLLNGSGLFFSAFAAGLAPTLLHRTAMAGSASNAVLLTALTLAAVAAQSYAALRNRRAWDGVERRQPETPAVASAVPANAG